MLHLQLLGPLLARDDDGKDLTPPGARERDGLATLAVVSPDPLSTDRIANELYGERDTADPRNAVQAMVSRLRRSLGRSAGAVETTTNGYRLVDTTLDLDEAERLLRATMTETDPAEAANLLGGALAMWHGPTLDGLNGELIEAERLRIDGLRADAEDWVLERRLLAGSDRELVGALEDSVRGQPLREKRWELLMRALYGDGRQADALRAFQRARSLLSNHLGLEPGPGLARLEQQILAHDPALEADDGAEDQTRVREHHIEEPLQPTGPTPLPSGTLSVLLCDVEGSVRRWEAAPDHTAREIDSLHRIWSEATEANRGHLVKSTGDGILAVFETAASAVTAAATAMGEQQDKALRVRVAINTGSLAPVDGGDYRGPVVNRCARLLDLAHGGQILVTGGTAELAADELTRPEPDRVRPDGQGRPSAPVSLRDLGVHWLRDVPEPVAVWQVEAAGVLSNFPALNSRGPESLPRLRGELFGRTALIDEVRNHVEDHKVVTLLGPGGIGKTSLALAVAWQVAETRPVAFIDLARVDDPSAVAQRMADGMVPGERDGARDPIDRMSDRLRANTDLVIIDNAEHLLDAVAEVTDRILGHELKGSFLVTSRHPLGLQDETIVGVPPLELPEDGDDLGTTGRSPSVQLFVQRARSIRPDFEIPSGLLPVVAHICRRLDGIPLAIELAAGRASLLSIDDIAARLDDQLRLLRQVRSNRDRRHRSLEAVVGWSVDQLSPPARELFDRLSVMSGGFGLDGVEAILGHCDLDPLDALELLDELTGASLVTVEPGGSRFRMLEPIRQFAAAELSERGLEDETRRAHATWLIHLVEDLHRRRDESRAEATLRVDAEADQLRAAMTWLADTGSSDLAADIAFPSSWWFLTHDPKSGERLLSRLLAVVDRADDPLGWAKVTLAIGIATAAEPGSLVAETSQQALELFDEAGHPDRGLARLAAAFSLTGLDDPTRPLQLLDEAAELVGPGDRWARALVDMTQMTMRSLVLLLDSAGDAQSGDAPPGDAPSADARRPAHRPETEAILEQGLAAAEVFRRLGETWALGVGLGELGRLYQTLGRLDEAEACFLESIDLFGNADYHGSHYLYTELGRLATARGDHELARRYHLESVAIAEANGNRGCMAESLAGMGHAAEARNEPEVALDFYRRATALGEQRSLVERGHDEWRVAVERLSELVDQANR